MTPDTLRATAENLANSLGIPARYGAETPVIDWRERLVCPQMGQPRNRYGRDRDRAGRSRLSWRLMRESAKAIAPSGNLPGSSGKICQKFVRVL
jgi:hypothetical protein